MNTIQVDPQAYRDFLTGVKIHEIYIKSLTAIRTRDIGSEGAITITCGPKSHEIKKNRLIVEFHTVVDGKQSKSHESMFNLEVMYEAVYTMEREPSDSQFVQLFVNNNVIVHVWPYVRELVSNLAYRMNLPPITLSLKVN
ncbi:MAG: protein-export chaperone SecB [Bacillota bacterium]|jgi:preprotein translocase subunit SecB